jgi:NADP-dependent aldehyde dehydrogenase
VAILVDDETEIISFIDSLDGQLTGTIHGTKAEISEELMDTLLQKVGRLLFNGFPTGVEVSGAMVHGGPFPATTDSRSTSVGTQAIYRFTRMVCLQNRV